MTQPTSSALFVRQEWQSLSQFHPHSEEEVLKLIAHKIVLARETTKPLVLLDLDSTLYEVGPRTLAIIHEWLSNSPKIPSELKTALGNLSADQIGYSIKDTFSNVGFPVVTQELESVSSALKAFWWDRFFSSDYLSYDRPYPGAVEYTNHLYDLGADICYLTGRDEKRMRKGTLHNLERDGFPIVDKGTQLIMRQIAEWSDAKHKTQAALNLDNQGRLIASLENEPVNLIALAKLLPNTVHVFVDTVCSDSGAEPGKNLYRIKGFSAHRPDNYSPSCLS